MKEQLLRALTESRRKLPIHHCSICNYPCGFMVISGQLHYDSGCDCVSYQNFQSVPASKLDFYLDPANRHLENIKKFIEEATK